MLIIMVFGSAVSTINDFFFNFIYKIFERRQTWKSCFLTWAFLTIFLVAGTC